MSSKYCHVSSIVEWFINPIKTHKNGSIGWKTIVLVFRLMRNWTPWRIGNGIRVKINQDPWVGASERYRLSEPLILQLGA